MTLDELSNLVESRKLTVDKKLAILLLHTHLEYLKSTANKLNKNLDDLTITDIINLDFPELI